VLFLYWDAGNLALRELGAGVKQFLDLSHRGATFVLGVLARPDLLGSTFGQQQAVVFATLVLPTLIFFSSCMGVLYHLGVMQLVVRGMAAVTMRVLGTSGAESLSACGNIFVGQTEAPLLVRPFLARMTTSELHAVMTGGFATIAGGVFALYVGFGVDPGLLIVASVMAAPAGLMVSKLLWPETGVSETIGRVAFATERTAGNVVEAAANGALDGLRLALNVAAMLIAFLGLVAAIDWILGPIGVLFGFAAEQPLTLGWLFGRMFWPIAAVLGAPSGEVTLLAELLGTKLALTELVAYQKLGPMIQSGEVSARTAMLASFALCGFANVGSVAIQIGGLGGIAPERKGEIARLAFRAMFAGAITTCMTAALAGVVRDA
jgi:CNT family concentrative nucleoside transporter